MEEENYGMADAAYDPYALQRRAAEQARHGPLQGAGRAQGAFITSASAINTPKPVGLTERISKRLAHLDSILAQAQDTLSSRHISLFGCPAPSGVAELRGGHGRTGETPSNAEATIFALIDILTDRASDLEAAASSLTSSQRLRGAPCRAPASMFSARREAAL